MSFSANRSSDSSLLFIACAITRAHESIFWSIVFWFCFLPKAFSQSNNESTFRFGSHIFHFRLFVQSFFTAFAFVCAQTKIPMSRSSTFLHFLVSHFILCSFPFSFFHIFLRSFGYSLHLYWMCVCCEAVRETLVDRLAVARLLALSSDFTKCLIFRGCRFRFVLFVASLHSSHRCFVSFAIFTNLFSPVWCLVSPVVSRSLPILSLVSFFFS